MNNFITKIESINDCPINTPAVTLAARHSGLILSQIKLNGGQKLIVKYLGLQFIKFTTFSGIGKLNSSLPICYVGIYHGNFEKFNKPVAQPIVNIGSDIPGYFNLDYGSFNFELPGVYSFVLVNNAAVSNIMAGVTGVARTII